MSLKRYTRDVVLLGMVLATVVAVFLSDINDIQAQIALPSDPAAQQAQATAQNNQNALDNVAQQGPAFQICDVTDTCYPLSQPVCTVSHPDPNFSGTYRISYDGQEQMTGGNIPTNYSTTQIVQLFRDQCTHRYILEQQCANACWTNIIMAPIRMSGAPPLSAAAFTGVACSTYNSNETSGNTNCSGIVPTGVIGNAGSTPPNNTTPRPQCVPDLLCSPTSANQCGTDCDGCLEPDGSPNVRNTDGTSCWRLKSGQPNYCERIPNCPFRFPPTAGYPVTMARQPLDWEWSGGCGSGSYGGMIRDETHEDLYPSVTGCYNPEERYTKPVPIANPYGAGQVELRIPRDDILTLHPKCVDGDAVLNNAQNMPDQVRTGGNVTTKDDELKILGDAEMIACLHDDYIDDFDAFCRFYTGKEDKYLRDKWIWNTNKTDNNGNVLPACWDRIDDDPAFSAPIPGEHYLPLAYYVGDKAVPDGKTGTIRYGNMGEHGFGQYRVYANRLHPFEAFIQTPIDNHTGSPVWPTVTHGFNARNIYNVGGGALLPPSYGIGPNFAVDISAHKYVGRKYKLQECVRMYLHEYAHLADCGRTVLHGAKNVTEGHCQWVVMAKQDQNITPLQSLRELMGDPALPIGSILNTVFGALGYDLSPSVFKRKRRGLRPEYFDYQNMATAAWVPAMPHTTSGGITGQVRDASSDICKKAIGDGTQPPVLKTQVLNDGSKMRFEKRGCPVMVGPDRWPDYFDMRQCNFDRGAMQFLERYQCNSWDPNDGSCTGYDPASMAYAQGPTVDGAIIPKVFPVNPGLTTNINNPLSVRWWYDLDLNNIPGASNLPYIEYISGIGGFNSTLGKQMAANTLPPNLIDTNFPLATLIGINRGYPLHGLSPAITTDSDGSPMRHDYVDPLWVARTCTHYAESSNWGITDIENMTGSTDAAINALYIGMDYWWETPDYWPDIICGTNGCGPHGFAPKAHVDGFRFYGGNPPSLGGWPGSVITVITNILSNVASMQSDDLAGFADSLGVSPGVVNGITNAVNFSNQAQSYNSNGGGEGGNPIGTMGEFAETGGFISSMVGGPETPQFVTDANKKINETTTTLNQKTQDIQNSFSSLDLNINLGSIDGSDILNAAGFAGFNMNCIATEWSTECQAECQASGTCNPSADCGGEDEIVRQTQAVAVYRCQATCTDVMINCKMAGGYRHSDGTFLPRTEAECEADELTCEAGCLSACIRYCQTVQQTNATQGDDIVICEEGCNRGNVPNGARIRDKPSRCAMEQIATTSLPVVYDWEVNLARIQDSFWCEFEVPYLPHFRDAPPDWLTSTPPVSTIAAFIDVWTDSFSYIYNSSHFDPAYLLTGSIINERIPLDDIVCGQGATGCPPAGLVRADVFKRQTNNSSVWSSAFPEGKWGKLRAIYGEENVDSNAPGAGLEEPGIVMVERIRDGCNAFSQRATWSHDQEIGLALWLMNREHSRCHKWTGIYRREYDSPKIVSWRLPRFNYEFLKAFVQCTGPVYSEGPNVCTDLPNLQRVLSNAVPTNYYGRGIFVNMDDETRFRYPWRILSGDLTHGGVPFGFWCTCPIDDFFTTRCNESFCTCEAINVGTVPWVFQYNQEATVDVGNWPTQTERSDSLYYDTSIGPTSFSICTGMGPFARWLQCYYQARSKACPVLTREISNGIPSSLNQLTDPADLRKMGSSSFNVSPKLLPEDITDPNTVCEGIDIKASYENLRWTGPEPNILAHLPITAEFGARDNRPLYNESKPASIPHEIGYMKNRDLVFQSSVRDIEAPFMEITVPWPLTESSPSAQLTGVIGDYQHIDINKEILKKSLNAANDAWLTDRVSTIGPGVKVQSGTGMVLTGTDPLENPIPHPRATEAIVGPYGCDIGGWYEMMLYQARCIKWFKLNCLCDYGKTFVEGSAEAYVLQRAGMVFKTKEAYVDQEGGGQDIKIREDKRSWPMMWRGYAGPDYAPIPEKIQDPGTGQIVEAQTHNPKGIGYYDEKRFKLWLNSSYKGLDDAQPGDFMIYDEELKDNQGRNARYRRHIAYVEEVTKKMVRVTEKNWGKNQDSCGNTDRWNWKGERRIFKNKEDVPEGYLCDNPDYLVCHEPNWYRIKLYRPDQDTLNPDRPICDYTTLDPYFGLDTEVERTDIDGNYIPLIPMPLWYNSRALQVQIDKDGNIVKLNTGIAGLQPVDISSLDKSNFDAAAIQLDPFNFVYGGFWKLSHLDSNFYDHHEVSHFLEMRLGKCDVPVACSSYGDCKNW